MDKNNEIQEELRKISPELANILPEKKAVPMPDADYFDCFTENIVGKRTESPVIPITKRERFIRYLMVAGAAAAIVTALFMFGLNLTKSEMSSSEVYAELAKVSDEELEAFLDSGEQINENPYVQEQLKKLDLNEISSIDTFIIYEN